MMVMTRDNGADDDDSDHQDSDDKQLMHQPETNL